MRSVESMLKPRHHRNDKTGTGKVEAKARVRPMISPHQADITARKTVLTMSQMPGIRVPIIDNHVGKAGRVIILLP